jgi:hypothetical protein
METSVKPQGCTNLKLRQLDRVVTRHYDAYLSATGMKNTQYSLLSHVAALGPIRPSDLAQRMGLDASTLTRNLQPLVSQGWLRMGPGDDARSRLIEATKEGPALPDRTMYGRPDGVGGRGGQRIKAVSVTTTHPKSAISVSF